MSDEVLFCPTPEYDCEDCQDCFNEGENIQMVKLPKNIVNPKFKWYVEWDTFCFSVKRDGFRDSTWVYQKEAEVRRDELQKKDDEELAAYLKERGVTWSRE